MSTASTQETTPAKKSLRSDLKPVWCPGCGDYGVIAGLDQALQELGHESHDIVFVSGIGCSSRLPYFFNTYGFHSIHGRGAAVAMGVKVANPELRVFLVGGDGDLFSIGTNHFIHTARRNIDITCICMDNHIYGLTKGQLSPTSGFDYVTSSSPYGAIETPINPLMVALTSGATFVAQTFSGNVKHMRSTIVAAERHPGFSFVNVISPCVTFNRVDTFATFKSRVALSEAEASEHLAEAYRFLLEAGTAGQIPLGTFFEVHRDTFDGAQEKQARKAQEKLGVPSMEQVLESFA
jgi:2-oxoglutarate ferredoxin oxidoreductase subunit beta